MSALVWGCVLLLAFPTLCPAYVLRSSHSERCRTFRFLPCWLLHALKEIAGTVLYGGESTSRRIDEKGDLFDGGGQIKERSLKVANWRPQKAKLEQGCGISSKSPQGYQGFSSPNCWLETWVGTFIFNPRDWSCVTTKWPTTKSPWRPSSRAVFGFSYNHTQIIVMKYQTTKTSEIWNHPFNNCNTYFLVTMSSPPPAFWLRDSQAYVA